MDDLIGRIKGVVPNTRIVPVLDTEGKALVPDTTEKFIVYNGAEESFLIISGVGNPNIIKRAVDNIHAARSLAGSAGEAILPPTKSGEIDGRSFAIWERETPFSDSKLGRLKARWIHASKILDWCHDFGGATMTPAVDVDAQFSVPLASVQANSNFPTAMRDDAGRALDRLPEWTPMQCVQHGDFWIGNVLLKRDGSLAVIDWAGAKINGYPVIDMTRMLISLGCSNRTREHYLTRLSATLSCDRLDLTTYALAALGDLGANLEHFPQAMYHDMSIRIHAFLSGCER